MPLSEEEQRILHEIEQQFYESDPDFAREVGKTSLFRHAGKNLKWAGAGFVVGFAVLILSFTFNLFLGFLGFLVMLASAFVFERNLRRMGRAGLRSARTTARAASVRESFGNASRNLRKRFRREDP